MTHDPAWDMPTINWQAQGSYENGIIPLVAAPDDEPLVCLPSINVHWLPIVLGCLDQLRNPSTWITVDDDAMAEILYKSARLLQMIGDRSECVCTLVRLESCQLQTSCDNGATWNTVPGWDPGFGECVQEFIPVIGLPPNPGDEAPSQFACSIAGYLANDVILKAITQAITSITDDIALLGFGTVLVDLIPEFVLVTAAFNAFTIIYTAISEGTIADYEAARDDPALWQAVQCAIYGCIVSAGYVTPGNFACIVSAVSGISYVHSDVISLIVSFIESLGATGLAQLSQRAGLVPGADCSSCENWCYEWSPLAQAMDVDWTAGVGPPNPEAMYNPTTMVWDSVAVGPVDGTYDLDCAIELDLPGWHVNQIGVTQVSQGGGDETDRYVEVNGTFIYPLSFAPGTTTTTVTVGENITHCRISNRTRLISVPLVNNITLVRFRGNGIDPIGTDNCSS